MKHRKFSLRDQKYIQELTQRLCKRAGLTEQYADTVDWSGIGWECFLEVFYRQPESFLGSGSQGWYAVRDAIWDRLLAEKAVLFQIKFKQWSLDAPVSDEIEEPRVGLLPFSIGDCVNAVCLHDFLNRLDPYAPDAVFLAKRFMEGDTESEIYRYYNWSNDRYQSAFTILRTAMEEYEQI